MHITPELPEPSCVLRPGHTSPPPGPSPVASAALADKSPEEAVIKTTGLLICGEPIATKHFPLIASLPWQHLSEGQRQELCPAQPSPTSPTRTGSGAIAGGLQLIAGHTWMEKCWACPGGIPCSKTCPGPPAPPPQLPPSPVWVLRGEGPHLACGCSPPVPQFPQSRAEQAVATWNGGRINGLEVARGLCLTKGLQTLDKQVPAGQCTQK